MNLTVNEMTEISLYLCHYKENGNDDPNWKMIKYDMMKYDFDLDKSCPD